MRRDPSPDEFAATELLYETLAADGSFARLQRLMEVDWSAEADITVEDVGLARLLRSHAVRLRAVVGDDAARWNELAQTIRYTERRDELARTALWWLGQLARDPFPRRSSPLGPQRRPANDILSAPRARRPKRGDPGGTEGGR